jgi:hypothetical protein
MRKWGTEKGQYTQLGRGEGRQALKTYSHLQHPQHGFLQMKNYVENELANITKEIYSGAKGRQARSFRDTSKRKEDELLTMRTLVWGELYTGRSEVTI